jgi:hypothetical protein
MSGYAFNTAVAVVSSLLLLRGVTKGLIKKNIIGESAVIVSLLMGAFLFKGSEMAVWALLVLQTYTDMTEQHVFPAMTGLIIIIEVVYMLAGRTYLYIRPGTLIFPTVIIVAVSMLMGTFAAGDMEIFLVVMLDSYNHGLPPDAFIVYYMLITCVVFALYMGVKNAIRKLRHQDLLYKGAYVPAMTVTYFVMFLWKYLS